MARSTKSKKHTTNTAVADPENPLLNQQELPPPHRPTAPTTTAAMPAKTRHRRPPRRNRPLQPKPTATAMSLRPPKKFSMGLP